MYSKDSVDLSDMLPLDGYEEVKKGKELKISKTKSDKYFLSFVSTQ